jgi:pilus assembly protein CpaE
MSAARDDGRDEPVGGRIVTGTGAYGAVGGGSGQLTVTLLTANTKLRPWVAQIVGGRVQVRVQPWQSGDEPRGALGIVDEITADSVDVLCIADDVPLELAFAVAARIDQAHAHISVLLFAAPWPDVWREALRSGVRDVVDPGKGHAEVAPALERALKRGAHLHELRAAAAAPAAPETGRVIVVLSAKGGSGKTMVASNLAAALARTARGPVALVDLDAQFGDAASALGLVPEHTIAGLAVVPEIDPTTLKVFLTPHEPSGAFVLCGAASPEEGDTVTDKHAGRVIELLSRDFACVVVDTSAGIDELTLAALDHATDAVLVSTMDVSSIRNLGKEIYALDRVGLLPSSRHFVLNRADARVGIDVADVRAALGMDVDASVPSSRTVPLSMNQGSPIVVDDPSSPGARELMKLAARFVSDAAPRDEAADGPAGRHARVEPGGTWFRRRAR